jgi:hypothetical protein
MSITVEDRQVRRRLAILRHAEEVTGNVAMTCRYYGITRQSFYLWKRRYEELGPDGLKDRSRRPKTSPNATHADVVGKILYLRQNYHFGPGKIAMYLARYHDVSISSSGCGGSSSDLNRLPASQRYKRLDRRWQRYEKQLPGHQVQIDVKFIAPIAGASRRKHYQFTAIDDCTRLRVLRIYSRLNERTAIQFADGPPTTSPGRSTRPWPPCSSGPRTGRLWASRSEPPGRRHGPVPASPSPPCSCSRR